MQRASHSQYTATKLDYSLGFWPLFDGLSRIVMAYSDILSPNTKENPGSYLFSKLQVIFKVLQMETGAINHLFVYHCWEFPAKSCAC